MRLRATTPRLSFVYPLLVLGLVTAIVLAVAGSPPPVGAAGSDANYANVFFDVHQQVVTEADSVENVALEGRPSLNTNIENSPDTGAAITGDSGLGGPTLELATTSPADSVETQYLTAGSVPGTAFNWGLPVVAENGGYAFYASSESPVSSFTPGFTASRSADITAFTSAGGDQVLTITVTPEEPMEFLAINCSNPGSGYCIAAITEAHWVNGAPADSGLTYDSDHIESGIGSPTVGTEYVLQFTTHVISTVPGVSVDYMPRVVLASFHVVERSDTPTSGSSLAHAFGAEASGIWGGSATWTWAATGTYLWTWCERAVKDVFMDGYARLGQAYGNQVQADFDTVLSYFTQGDSVADTALAGAVHVNGQVYNVEDATGQPVVGASAQGGPVLHLEATSNLGDIRQEYLVEGSVPGTVFTWGFPSVGQDEGQVGYGNLEAPVIFTPGFSVTRVANQTTFSSAGGVQEVVLTAVPDVAMQRFHIGGNVHPGGSGQYTASLLDVEWETTPPGPAGTWDIWDGNPNGFSLNVQSPQVGFAYTVRMTIQVASTLPGVDVTYMPNFVVQNQWDTDSGGPVGGSSHQQVTAYGTWTWTALGDYFWSWSSRENKAVYLNGYANSDVNHVHLRFEPAEIHSTEGDAVANAPLDGYASLRAALMNPQDSLGAPVTGPSSEGGPFFSLDTTSAVVRASEDHLVSGSVPGTAFTWGFPPVPEDGDVGCEVDLQGMISFTPGYAVSRSADVTAFTSAGGTQHVVLTVTPEEPVWALNFTVDAQVGDPGGHTANIVAAEWVNEPPGPVAWFSVDAQRVSGLVMDPQVGFAYTIAVTINVASSTPGAAVDYLPEVQVQGQHEMAASSEPSIGSAFERTATDATWSWQATGTYLWTWHEILSKVVNLRGHATAANLPPVLYAGGDAVLSGSFKVAGPMVSGEPSAAVYVNGALTTSGSVDTSQAALYVAGQGAAVPPLGRFMPDALVASLVLASQAAQPAGTVHSGLSYSGSRNVTLADPITVNGNLMISGSGTYSFDSVYVTGNVSISGSATVTFASLHVGGNLSVGGSGFRLFGPTYVAGSTALSGSGQWNGSLLVTTGTVAITGSIAIGGDGVGTHARPVRMLVVGAGKAITLSGSGTIYGQLYNQSGNVIMSGSKTIRGSVLCGGSVVASGTCDLEYDPTVIDNLE